MRRSSGFTLLEVMVAMTITGLALGALFSVIAGNKRLAWRAEAALVKSMQARSLLNLVQLNDEQGEVYIALDNQTLELNTGIELETPERKTEPTAADLHRFELTNDGEVVYQGSYWIKQVLPTQASDNPLSSTSGTQTNGETSSAFGAQPATQGTQARSSRTRQRGSRGNTQRNRAGNTQDNQQRSPSFAPSNEARP
jgi:prepilin-type N-terminal cleavage/methylation domain-containing protein